LPSSEGTYGDARGSFFCLNRGTPNGCKREPTETLKNKLPLLSITLKTKIPQKKKSRDYKIQFLEFLKLITNAEKRKKKKKYPRKTKIFQGIRIF